MCLDIKPAEMFTSLRLIRLDVDDEAWIMILAFLEYTPSIQKRLQNNLLVKETNVPTFGYNHIQRHLNCTYRRPGTDWLPADMASDYILAPMSDLFPAGLIPLFIVRIPDAIHMFKNGELLASRLGFGGGIQPVTGMWWADFVTGGLFQFARLHAGSHLYRNLARQV